MNVAEPGPIRVIPRLEDIITAGEMQRIREEHEALSEGVAQWVLLIRSFIEQAERANFTDRNGHTLEMSAAYKALKDSVSE